MRIVSREDILVNVHLPHASRDQLLKEGVRVTRHAMQGNEDVVRFCDFVDLLEPSRRSSDVSVRLLREILGNRGRYLSKSRTMPGGPYSP